MISILQSRINIELNWCPHCTYGPKSCYRYIPNDGNCLYWRSKQSPKAKKKFLSKGAVDWYIPGRKNPFARTSGVDAKLIKILYEEEKDLRKVYARIQDSDSAKKVIEYYLRRKIYKLEFKK